MREWSKYQAAIFEHVENRAAGNLIVEAVAGSGKTTTIVEATKRVPGTVIFLAFNKSIADELKSRGVNARTFHSLCYGPVADNRGTRNSDSDKMYKLVKANLSGDDAYLYGTFIRKLCGLAKQAGIGTPLRADTAQAWLDIVEHHDLELETEGAELDRAIELARKLLVWSNEAPSFDFDDMLYMVVKFDLRLPKFDVVFVDEAQDTNAIQREILRKIMKPTSRLIAVGDPAQAIYGFRGADSGALGLIGQAFKCKTLPLSVSYRCASSIVAFARTWVAHIEAREGAPEGVVSNLGGKWDVDLFLASDLVVCRTTKALVALGYRMIKARMPVRIMGKEIGAGLVTLVRKMGANTIDDLVAALAVWASRETDKALENEQEAKAAAIADKAEAITVLIDGLGENERTVDALCNLITNLFSDKAGCTTLATIHKAKGLEAERVFWLNASQCPSKWARQEWQKKQERNLCYVAATRAKSALVLIEEPA